MQQKSREQDEIEDCRQKTILQMKPIFKKAARKSQMEDIRQRKTCKQTLWPQATPWRKLYTREKKALQRGKNPTVLSHESYAHL